MRLGFKHGRFLRQLEATLRPHPEFFGKFHVFLPPRLLACIKAGPSIRSQFDAGATTIGSHLFRAVYSQPKARLSSQLCCEARHPVSAAGCSDLVAGSYRQGRHQIERVPPEPGRWRPIGKTGGLAGLQATGLLRSGHAILYEAP
jgi:hypothetical protein